MRQLASARLQLDSIVLASGKPGAIHVADTRRHFAHEGQPLFRYEETTLHSGFEIAKQALTFADAASSEIGEGRPDLDDRCLP